MSSVKLDDVVKVYSNGFEAVHGISLDVADGEFMVLVGPSGCGKTTLLRMVAGLEEVTSGDIYFGDKVVNGLTPKQRDIAMVFQNYALYPHMTVAQNIGFALKLQRMPNAEVRSKVEEAAGVLGLTEWLDRKPGQLSGGQRQRVAMGRAIVRSPSVFLMDEPLSNLDAKLRVQMRAEVSRIQRHVGVATVYVTHDQVEAMTMGDRVAVLRSGDLQQCADPQTLYERPVNMFVAAFIGSPAMNLYEGEVAKGSESVGLGSQDVPLPGSALAAHPRLKDYSGRSVVVGIRPEHLPAANGSAPWPIIKGLVTLVEALGNELQLHFNIDAKRVIAEGASTEDTDELVTSGEGVARVDPRTSAKVGELIELAVDVERIEFFDKETGESIRA